MTYRPGEDMAKAKASALDVAEYILRKQGAMSSWKLQKLVYYCQAWSTVWDDRPLFSESIQAWANGPVVRSLYQVHKGMFSVSHASVRGNIARLDEKARKTIDAVLKFYGDKTGHWLSELTHRERPWSDARRGLKPGDRGEAEITPEALADYYGSLV
jgi:uncharacterized phage-associated protein